MDQSNRYADLSLRENDLIRGGGHILVAYKMKPQPGHGFLEAAAHFAAESSTGTNVEVSTTDEFTKGVDALVYQIDEVTEEMRIAYPIDIFDRNISDGRMMIVSFLTLVIGNNQGMGDIQHAKMYDFYMPPRAIQLFDGPSKDISDLWRILGRPVQNGGYIAGTIIISTAAWRSAQSKSESAAHSGWCPQNSSLSNSVSADVHPLQARAPRG